MALVFRTTDNGKWGSGKGANLTPSEVDNNFWDIHDRVLNLEDNPPQAAGISNITVDGSQMTVFLSDATEFGPFTLPTAILRWRDEWAASTSYKTFDLVKVSGVGVYVVLIDHISDTTFDEDAEESEGALYSKVFGLGLEGVETINSSSHTPILANQNKLLRVIAGGGTTVRIPESVSQDFPVGAILNYEQATAAGTVSFIPDNANVTLNVPPSREADTAEQYAIVSAIKVASDTWTLVGHMAAGSGG